GTACAVVAEASSPKLHDGASPAATSAALTSEPVPSNCTGSPQNCGSGDAEADAVGATFVTRTSAAAEAFAPAESVTVTRTCATAGPSSTFRTASAPRLSIVPT